MLAKLIVRIHPDDRIEVKVEGMARQDASRPEGQKLCEKVTKRLIDDLGTVVDHKYEDDEQELGGILDEEWNELGNM